MTYSYAYGAAWRTNGDADGRIHAHGRFRGAGHVSACAGDAAGVRAPNVPSAQPLAATEPRPGEPDSDTESEAHAEPEEQGHCEPAGVRTTIHQVYCGRLASFPIKPAACPGQGEHQGLSTLHEPPRP